MVNLYRLAWSHLTLRKISAEISLEKIHGFGESFLDWVLRIIEIEIEIEIIDLDVFHHE